MALEINDEDQASAIVQGLDKAEQKLLLRALIADMDEDDLQGVLEDEGILDG